MSKLRSAGASAPGLGLLAALLLAARGAAGEDAPPPPAPAAAAAETGQQGLRASPAAEEMLKSMREKGILSDEEYQELYVRQARYEERARQESEIPGWAKNWTFGGDLRFRVDRQNWNGHFAIDDTLVAGKQNVDLVNGTANDERTRGRFRLRIGAEKQIDEDFTVGFRLATAQSTTVGESKADLGAAGTPNLATVLPADPRSENQNYGAYFSGKSIWIDRAYLSWRPEWAPGIQAVIGKFENPLVSRNFSGDLFVWDHDISPEGAALSSHFAFLGDELALDTTGFFYVIDQIPAVTVVSTSTNTGIVTAPDPDDGTPYMFGIQSGLTARLADWAEAGIRGTFYRYEGIGLRFADALMSGNNGGVAINQNPLVSFVNGTAQLARSNGSMNQLVGDVFTTFTPWGERWAITPYFQVMAILNATQNLGWTAGIDLGSLDFAKLSFQYGYIPRNATPAVFTDSDFFDGFTNAEGFGVSLARRIATNFVARGTFYHASMLQRACDESNALQCSLGDIDTLLGAYRLTSLERNRIIFDLTVEF